MHGTLQRKSHSCIPEKELCGLSPNLHNHMSVSDLYIPRIGLRIFLQQNRQTDRGNKQTAHMQTHEYGSWNRGCAIFFREYLFRILGTVSLQCRTKRKIRSIGILRWPGVGRSRRVTKRCSLFRLTDSALVYERMLSFSVYNCAHGAQ